ncbi:MAG: ORC1-type DNA replication protein [Promethearchaeota archaeon]
MSKIIFEELRKRSIFLDESKFSLDYVPKNLINREKELRLLASYFRNLVLSSGTFKQHVLIQGPVGCGKTVLAKYFGREFEITAQKQQANVKYLHLNCRKLQSEASVLTTILKYLVPYFPPRGFGVDELLQMLSNTLEQKSMHLLLALDEIDFIIRRGAKELLYYFTRLNDDSPSNAQRLSLILITSDRNFRAWIDARTRSLLIQNLIRLISNSEETLVNILNTRAEGGFQPNAVPPEVINQIAEIAVDEGGDARVAIELLWLAGKRADQEGALKICLEYVREIRSRISSSFFVHREMLQALPQHKLILLLAIVRKLKSTKNTNVSLAETRESYSLLCEQLGVEPRRNTQIYNYCRELTDLGLVRTTILNKDIPGRTSRISVDAPLELLDQLATEILSNKSF